MFENLNLRLGIILAVLTLGVIWVIPNFVNMENRWWLTKDKVTLGLDIQGGLHLVMGVDVDGVMKEHTERNAASIEAAMKEEKAGIKSISTNKARVGEIVVEVDGADSAEKVKKYVDKNFSSILQIFESDSNKVVLRFYEVYVNDYRSKVLSQAIETLRNRVDEFGVSEPSITAQGNNRILVQLPGIKDAAKAKELINRTAKLEFMMLDNSMTREAIQKLIDEAEKAGGFSLGQLRYSEYINKLNEALKGKIPEKTVVYFEKSENAQSLEAGKIPFLLRTDTGLGGDSLKDAFVNFNEYGQPQVAISFNPLGGAKFADLTEKNVGKLMAVVLDRVVKSAPVIQGKIPNGQGVITLGGGRDRNKMMDEAKMISMALRAGALPATLEQLEERTVGPTLGADSIQKGKLAAMIGIAFVYIFIAMFYKFFGVVAVFCLSTNVLLTFAILTSLGSTITLPGVAGVALTVGIAVDASVIIFERIKEELLKGGNMEVALREGFDRAFTSIFDSNVTTMATCFVLIYFGTGPVRGFAVTLVSGIAVSLFTQVFLCRTILDLFVNRWHFKKLPI